MSTHGEQSPYHSEGMANMANAILETHEAVGHIMRELSMLHAKVSNLSDRMDEIRDEIYGRITERRERANSISDLDMEMTDGGTTRYYGTHEQLMSVVDARIKAIQDESALVRDAAVTRWAKKRSAIIICTALGMVAIAWWNVVWSVIKTLFTRK